MTRLSIGPCLLEIRRLEANAVFRIPTRPASEKMWGTAIPGQGEANLDKLPSPVRTLETIAGKHQVSIANIAVCAILERLTAAGVIVGYSDNG